ncbi:2'-5' RNA ligase family protein [Aestuariimicrobium sp. Y1814]|uniref:2'-5' RNA ligase family protein n=1 Tax=Aestuariimicrobium sp. Y1814 TaxID=3418742 RepID=UPI003DA7109E
MDEWTIPHLPVDPGWHGGRPHALVWACELGDPAGGLTDVARRRLGGLLLPDYRRQPHITVRYAGLMAAPGLAGYDGAALAADLACLRGLADGPVTVVAQGWDTFPMVPYLALGADWLHRAHEALPSPGDDGSMTYRPHLTVGQYAHRVRLDDVRAQLAGLAWSGQWVVRELALLRYDTDDISGPLALEGRFDLTTGEFTPAAGGVLASSEPGGKPEPQGGGDQHRDLGQLHQ